MIAIEELQESNFYQFFYERCEELFSNCKKTEKELFYPHFNGEMKNITEKDISHKNLVYSSFLKHLLTKNCFLLLEQTQQGICNYGRLFSSNINSKNLWKILKWMFKWRLYLDDIEYSNRFDVLKKWVYSFQYLQTEEKSNGKMTKKGLAMPVFGLPRYEVTDTKGTIRYPIVESLKKAQRRYETYEILRVLITFERMSKEKETYEHFFHSYINRLSNKFFEYRKNELAEDIKRKNNISKHLIKILKYIYKKEEDFNIIKIYLNRKEYDKAYKCYEDDNKSSKCKNHNKSIVVQCFYFLQTSIDKEYSETLDSTKSYELWLFQTNEKKQVYVSEEQNSNEYENAFSVLNNDYYNKLIFKYVKAYKKGSNNLDIDILTKIKQAIVRYSLIWDKCLDDEQLENIQERLCKDFSSYEHELIHLYVKKYPLVYRKMQEELKPFYNSKINPDINIIKQIKENIKDIVDYYERNNKFSSFIDSYKTQLAFFLQKDSYIDKNNSHKSFKGELIRNLESFKKKLNKEKNNIEYIQNYQKLIEIRIKQMGNK